jgi:hypothetical protein
MENFNLKRRKNFRRACLKELPLPPSALKKTQVVVAGEGRGEGKTWQNDDYSSSLAIRLAFDSNITGTSLIIG